MEPLLPIAPHRVKSQVLLFDASEFKSFQVVWRIFFFSFSFSSSFKIFIICDPKNPKSASSPRILSYEDRKRLLDHPALSKGVCGCVCMCVCVCVWIHTFLNQCLNRISACSHFRRRPRCSGTPPCCVGCAQRARGAASRSPRCSSTNTFEKNN